MQIDATFIVGFTLFMGGAFLSRFLLDRAFESLPSEEQLKIIKEFKGARLRGNLILFSIVIGFLILMAAGYGHISFPFIGIAFPLAIGLASLRMSARLKRMGAPEPYREKTVRANTIHFVSCTAGLGILILVPIISAYIAADRCLGAGRTFDYKTFECR